MARRQAKTIRTNKGKNIKVQVRKDAKITSLIVPQSLRRFAPEKRLSGSGTIIFVPGEHLTLNNIFYNWLMAVKKEWFI